MHVIFNIGENLNFHISVDMIFNFTGDEIYNVNVDFYFDRSYIVRVSF